MQILLQVEIPIWYDDSKDHKYERKVMKKFLFALTLCIISSAFLMAMQKHETKSIHSIENQAEKNALVRFVWQPQVKSPLSGLMYKETRPEQQALWSKELKPNEIYVFPFPYPLYSTNEGDPFIQRIINGNSQEISWGNINKNAAITVDGVGVRSFPIVS